MTTVLIAIIRLYQRTLSPDHGWWKGQHPYGWCKFYPTCSDYAIDALGRHGLWRGLWQATIRVLRCHPWSAGGVDPVRGSSGQGQAQKKSFQNSTTQASHGVHPAR